MPLKTITLLSVVLLLCTSSLANLILTLSDFVNWECQHICSKTWYKNRVKSICAKLSGSTDVGTLVQIITHSSCQKGKSLELWDHKKEKYVYFDDDVGVCQLPNDITMCVTKGQNKNDIITFKYESSESKFVPYKQYENFIDF